MSRCRIEGASRRRAWTLVWAVCFALAGVISAFGQTTGAGAAVQTANVGTTTTTTATANAGTVVRLKDIAYFAGVRENQLLGIGIITGLAGRGDSERSGLLRTAVGNLISTFGLEIPSSELISRNCAVVMVSAELPPFARQGSRLSVSVSSVGDARSLEGGLLLQTGLRAANGTVYVVAQGPVTVPSNGSRGAGLVPEGGIIEREVVSTFADDDQLSLILRDPDFSTANLVAERIRAAAPGVEVAAQDASLIRIRIPEERRSDPVAFAAFVEMLEIEPDTPARVVIDPRSGIVVIGAQVRISPVAVSYRGAQIQVGQTASRFTSGNPHQFVLDGTSTVQDLVSALQAVGLSTDTIIEMLQAVERAGALHAELIVM